MTPKWTDADLQIENDRSVVVRIFFDKRKDAEAYLKFVERSKDIDMDLLVYGEGVLRTMRRGRQRRA